MNVINPSLTLFAKGTSQQKDKVTNERIVLANIIYITVAVVTALGYIYDYEVFLQPLSSIVFDQISSLILMVLALFCYYINISGHFYSSKVLFTISWLLLSFYLNPFIQETSEDYYFHYDAAILFISILIQILFSTSKERVTYTIFTIFTFITIIYHQQYLIFFDVETDLSKMIEENKYIRLIPVYYWFLFNLVVAYVIAVYERSHKEASKQNQAYHELNQSLEKLVSERTENLKKHQEDLEFTSTKLKESQQRYYDFVHNSFEGVARFEMVEPMYIGMKKEDQVTFLLCNQYIAECNDSFARMYGFISSEEVTGKKLKDLWSDTKESETVLMEYIQNDYQFDKFQTFEETITGEKKWFVNFGKSTIVDNHLHMLWITQVDITQQINARSEREKLLADLKEYAFITSHEIRRPLSNLMGIANLITAEDSGKDMPTMTKYLKTSAEELDALVRQMGETLSRTSYFEGDEPSKI